MNSLSLPSFLLFQSPPRFWSQSRLQLQPQCILTYHKHCQGRNPPSLSLTRAHQSSTDVPSNEGVVSVINFEDLVEKDWSFLDSDNSSSNQEYMQKIDRIISAGEIGETSRILVSIGSEGFVDRLVDSSPCKLLLVVHDSLFVLACIKEKYDNVKCWQGELMYLPDKWVPLDVAFLYFLPASPFTLDEVFGALAKHCLSGARLVISHPQGRKGLEQERKQYPDVVVSDLPDKMTLQKVAANHSFEIAEYVDDPDFYLAVLRFCQARDSR